MKFHSGCVALVGRPNAGKSTLFNAVIRMPLSIVTAKPNTTRDRLMGVCDVAAFGVTDAEMLLMDSPGVLGKISKSKLRSGQAMDRYLDRQVHQAIQDPDLIWWLVPPRSDATHQAVVVEQLKWAKAPIVLVRTMSDVGQTAPLDLTGLNIVADHSVCATSGQGLDALVRDTAARLPERAEEDRIWPKSDFVSDRPTRYFVSEIIRKHLVLQLQEELPYVCAVQITKFDEKSKPVRIEADVIVERDSQKAMVVGQGGSRIRSIGSEARKDIEQLLDGGKIFLGLRVVVRKNWTHQEQALQQLGYRHV